MSHRFHVQKQTRNGRAVSPVHGSAMDGRCETWCGVDCRNVGTSLRESWGAIDAELTCRACIRIQTYDWLSKYLKECSRGTFGESRQLVLDALQTIRETDGGLDVV